MTLPYDLPLTNLAKKMRRQQTDTERLFWHEVRGKKVKGYKFHRQKPIGPYIADFYCDALSLVIELDGEIHDTRKEYDQYRTSELKALGLTVIRYSNNQVLHDLKRVLNHLYNVIHFLESHPSRLREGRGESEG